MLSAYLEKIKRLAAERKADSYVALLIVLVSVTSFGLGRLSAIWPQKTPITIEEHSSASGAGESTGLKTLSQDKDSRALEAKGKYVASKNGKSYHLPWCSGALLIKEENKLWFQTKEEATRAGYAPAGNCPGL